ncbi:hypothetical protein ACOZ4L_04235 [Haloplanus ruber]|uniref:DUF8153 domain-containing protein n=1 Tax=Haloplanus ruber TaxID=869892 RepID=A0ABD6D178_9EURY|nr:hypothetical protein [Haloplanus ruber]
MRRSLRYLVATAVAVGIAALTAVTADSTGLTLLSVPIVYGPTTALVLAHWQTWVSLSRQPDPSRKLGAIGGGVGAFAMSSLFRVSVPVGAVGFGLMLFGMAVTIADVSTLDQ